MSNIVRQAVLKYLRRLVDLLNGTLLDTERVLFDSIVTAAVRHFGMVKKDHAFACTEILRNLAVLKKAKPKRLATLASGPKQVGEGKLTDEEWEFLLKIARNPGEQLNTGEATGTAGQLLWVRLEEWGLLKCIDSFTWEPTDKVILTLKVTP